MSDQERTAAAKPSRDREKQPRPYKAPALVEYGSIARLTHSGGSTVREGSVPTMNMGCL
jgi:hypothetical protein